MDIKAIYQRYVAEKFARLKARIFQDYAAEEIQEYCPETENLRVDNSSGHDGKKKGGFFGGHSSLGLCPFHAYARCSLPSDGRHSGIRPSVWFFSQ